jgi:glycerol uptake facilitator-like aquaporin
MTYENNDKKIKNVNSRNSVTLQICKVIPICHENNRLTSNQKIFLAAIIGAFTIVFLATAPKVIKIKYFGTSELWTLVLLSGIGVALAVKAFVKKSKAHFNPAVTVGSLISGHILPKQIVLYLSAQVIGAFAASRI